MGGKAQDFFEEETQEGVEQEALQDEDTAQEEESSDEPEVDRLAALEAKIDRMMTVNVSQKQDNAAVETKPKLTKEQIAAIKEDPSLLISILDEHTKNVETRVSGQLQQKHWDDRAYSDFPSLKNDKKFEGLVTKEIQQLVATGAMSREHPQLLYHAARLASANYKAASGGNSQVSNKPKNAMAPGSRAKSTQQNADAGDVRKSPEYQYLRMAGWKEDKIKAAMARHKRREVVTKSDPVSGKTRKIIRLGGDT